MRLIISFVTILFLFNSVLMGQQNNKTDSSFIIQLNQEIDNYVLKRDTASLAKLYAEGFVLKHGRVSY